ncbi:hypothetical protein [Streptomyces sioyaensis]|uniref:hypothetical protein n=1 Tax=Streptomyces sioyaensis TaxID=67364 RepID=UPI0036EC35B0
MPDEQPPRPAEPTLAEFREFVLNAAQERPGPGFWQSMYQDHYVRTVVGAADAYADHVGAPAVHARTGDPNPTDTDPLDAVRDIAAGYAADGADTRDDYLDRLADELTLDDVRALRIAGEAAVAATPRVIWAESDRGKKPPRIADEIGLTVSRVYQILRERPTAGEQPAGTAEERRRWAREYRKRHNGDAQ